MGSMKLAIEREPLVMARSSYLSCLRDNGENPSAKQGILFLPLCIRQILSSSFTCNIVEKIRRNLQRSNISRHFCTSQHSFKLLIPLEVVRITETTCLNVFEAATVMRCASVAFVCVGEGVEEAMAQDLTKSFMIPCQKVKTSIVEACNKKQLEEREWVKREKEI